MRDKKPEGVFTVIDAHSAITYRDRPGRPSSFLMDIDHANARLAPLFEALEKLRNSIEGSDLEECVAAVDAEYCKLREGK